MQSWGQSVSAPRGTLYRPIAQPHLIAGQHATAAADCGDVTDKGTLARSERYEVGVEPAARGLHSFRFQLNLSSSSHRVIQLDS